MSEKKKVRFTFIDALVILVIVAVVGFVGYTMLGGNSVDVDTEDPDVGTYIVKYYFEEVPDFVPGQVKKGDEVTDEIRLHSLGKVTDIEVGPSVTFSGDSDGVLHKASKEGYNSLVLTTEVKAESYKHGIEISQAKYVVGHSMTVYAGKAKMYGRVASIEKK